MAVPYTLVEIKAIGDLAPGTQIAVKHLMKDLNPWLKYVYPLFNLDGYYYHHGVYLGECKVVHFYGINKADAKPRECDIWEFSKDAVDRQLYRVEYDDLGSLLPVEETLEKAKAVLGEPTKWPGFSIVSNNCESLATWLKTGKRVSAQAVQTALRLVSKIAGSAVLSCMCSAR